MRNAVYAGTFDPPTLGHQWMMGVGNDLFDNLFVAVGTNPDKKPTFTVDERMLMLDNMAKNARLKNVRITTFEGKFLVRYAEETGAQFILRGIRSEMDYGYERAMRHVNSDIANSVETVFLIPPRELGEISSSLVKGLVGSDGWEDVVEELLPDGIYQEFLAKFGGDMWIRWKRVLRENRHDFFADPLPDWLRNSYADLVKHYRTGVRSYHSLDHIKRCLDIADKYDVVPEIKLAIWFHDACMGKDAEKRSAALAEQWLDRIHAAGVVFAHYPHLEDVKELILATDHSKSTSNSWCRVIRDIDIAVFAAPWKEFDEYNNAIREEYADVPDEVFYRNRIKVLQKFLEKDAIFESDLFGKKKRAEMEKNAQNNLARAINEAKMRLEV
jgi:pantetheine-phosphate adenylyltransferase